MSLIAHEPSRNMPLADRLRAARLPEPSERRRIREQAGASLADVANEIGVSPMTVCRWERGEVDPQRVEHAIAYRRLLDELQALTQT